MCKQLCESCAYDYSNKVDVEDLLDNTSNICQARNKPDFNIAVLDIENLLAFSSKIDINPSMHQHLNPVEDLGTRLLIMILTELENATK